MSENKIKHLEFIHNTINRMSTNSFIIKGWSITLTSALFALAAKDADKTYVFITYFSIVFFWLLNAFFLKFERQFRYLYDDVRILTEDSIDFSMNISKYNSGRNTSSSAFFSKSLMLFYIPQIVISIIIMFFLS